MNIHDYLDPDRLLKAAIILEKLQSENSSNLNATFPHGRKVLRILMALSIKKHGYYFMKRVEQLKKEYKDKVDELHSFNEAEYILRSFDLANATTEDELLLRHVKDQTNEYKVGINAATLAYALSDEDTTVSHVRTWLHGLAGGYTVDYIAYYSGDSCKLAKDLISVAIKGTCENTPYGLEHVKKCFKFVVDDLANNFGFNAEDVYPVEEKKLD